MNKNYFYLFLPLLLFCTFFNADAQDSPVVLRDTTGNNLKNSKLTKDSSLIKQSMKTATVASADSTPPVVSHLQLSLTWQSNAVNNGRKDSSVIPLITPEISYIFKNGFEIDLSVGYNTHEASPQVNQYTLAGSYSYTAGNYSGSATVSGFIYSKHSASTTAEQKGSVASANNYDFGFIQPSLNLTWTFGTTPSDFQAAFALQHEFNIGNLSITPTTTMNAATQNAYNAYYQNRRFSIPRNDGKPPYPGDVTITGTVLNANKFQVLDYEFSAPIGFTAGKWVFNYTPIYAMPVHPADIEITTKTNHHSLVGTYKQTLPNVFYMSVGVTYDF